MKRWALRRVVHLLESASCPSIWERKAIDEWIISLRTRHLHISRNEQQRIEKQQNDIKKQRKIFDKSVCSHIAFKFGICNKNSHSNDWIGLSERRLKRENRFSCFPSSNNEKSEENFQIESPAYKSCNRWRLLKVDALITLIRLKRSDLVWIVRKKISKIKLTSN